MFNFVNMFTSRTPAPTSKFSRKTIEYVRNAVAYDIEPDVKQLASSITRFQYDDVKQVESWFHRDDEWLSLNEAEMREFLYQLVTPITKSHTTSQWVMLDDDDEDEIRYVRKSFLQNLPELLEVVIQCNITTDSELLRFAVELEGSEITALPNDPTLLDKVRYLCHVTKDTEKKNLVRVSDDNVSFNGQLVDFAVSPPIVMVKVNAFINLGGKFQQVRNTTCFDNCEFTDVVELTTPWNAELNEIPKILQVDGIANTILSDIYDDDEMSKAVREESTSIFGMMMGSSISMARKYHREQAVWDGDFLLKECEKAWDKLVVGIGSTTGTFVKEGDITEEDKLLVLPFVPMYGLTSKQWFLAQLKDVQEVQWKTEIFDELLAKPGVKELALALVSTQSICLDLVVGKGDNTTFLFKGEPGTGKTLMAEALSHKLGKALMKTSVSDLGVDAPSIEKRLTTFLRLAKRWDTMVLIDEADVFIEERTISDLNRNAIVNAFLRVLEYYEGVVFLTTNRDKTIDPAIHSRMTMVTHFTKKDLDQQRLWTDLLKRAGVTDITQEELETLTKLDLNGRVAKNVVASTLRVCQHHGGKPLTVKDLVDAAKIITG